MAVFNLECRYLWHYITVHASVHEVQVQVGLYSHFGPSIPRPRKLFKSSDLVMRPLPYRTAMTVNNQPSEETEKNMVQK